MKIQKEIISINGKKHGFILCEQDKKLPVMLYLPGGPGSPEYPIFDSELNQSNQGFNVCYYEHRGAGLSFAKKNAVMTLDELIEDVGSISRELIKRYRTSKILLVGHSFGSYLGIQAAKRYPELFCAYIGIGQVVNVEQSEKKIYQYLLKVCEKNSDLKNLKCLVDSKVDLTTLSPRYMMKIKGKIIEKYQMGLTRKTTAKDGMFKRLLKFKIYSFRDKINYIRGMKYSIKTIFPLMKFVNLFQDENVSYELPIYFIHGKYDGQVSLIVAKEYFNHIETPFKQFTVFEHSAHFPNIEESVKFQDILLMIINTYFM